MCDVVQLAVKAQDGESLNLSLLSEPTICDPLAEQPLCYAVDNHPCLTQLDLANTPTSLGCLKINMLIGTDNHWRLMTGEVIQHDSCPTVIKTRLGWVLSGPVQGQPTQYTFMNHVSSHVFM